ncbi:MAG: glucokinase [Deltaproteobacteria bacterium]|nr:glucokinase [Deltaproteobacteria bacterium]
MLIAGDIGGTKTTIGIYSRGKGTRKPLVERTFPSKSYDSLEAIVDVFLKSEKSTVDTAAFGIAGPVSGSTVKTTNLPWVVSGETIARKLKVKRAYLINDLEALAYSVPLLYEEDLVTINRGEAATEGAIGVIAPGTGLGEAFLTFDRSRYRAHASEGGHADFAPTGEVEIKLLHYLNKKYEHVSYERVCSGMAIPDIYEFLRDGGYGEEPDWLAGELSGVEDVTPVIVQGALSEAKSCELCSATLDLFVSVLGAEAGNLALKVMATGGLYIGGGIPPRIISLLEKPSFLQAFKNKGRYSDLMGRIPVHVITNPKAALIGAAFYGLEIVTA